MRNNILYFFRFFAVPVFCGLVALGQKENPRSMPELYNDWHSEMAANPEITDLRIVSINNVSDKLRSIVLEINENRLKMAVFLCSKIATEKSISYDDAYLFHETAGFYWFIIEGPPQHNQDVTANLKEVALAFSKNWEAGEYSNVADKISAICSRLVEKEGDEEIDSSDLLAIRRFGVFLMPELVRQVKVNNSKHAFAALLIINNDRKEYAAYLKESHRKYPQKAEKILMVRERIQKLAKVDVSGVDLAKRIRECLVDKIWAFSTEPLNRNLFPTLSKKQFHISFP